MRVKLKFPIHLRGKDYPRGIVELPESYREDKSFNRFLKAGVIEDADEFAKLAAPKPVHKPPALAAVVENQSEAKLEARAEKSSSEENSAEDGKGESSSPQPEPSGEAEEPHQGKKHKKKR